ncbi:MAG: hypothetical protein V7637_5976 [Mycobacteriales bacterium]|jgi:hypothetical protein
MVVWLRRRWFAVTFLVALAVADVLAGWTSSAWQSATARWASTNVVNLEHHPIGALVLSAFVTGGHPAVWPLLASMGVLSAERLLGPARTLLLCGSAQVIGTLVSEGIVAYRVQVGALPGSALSQLDVGPSYVVVAALTLAVLAGSWLPRMIALAGLLTLAPYLFTGLSHFDVAAVGHLISIALGMAAAALYQQNRARRRLRTAADPLTSQAGGATPDPARAAHPSGRQAGRQDGRVADESAA